MQWTKEEVAPKAAIELDTVYPYEVVSAEERTSKKGNPYISVKLVVFAGDEPKTMYDILMPQMAKKFIHFLRSNGLKQQEEQKFLSAEACVGCQGFILTTKKADDRGYPQVEDYMAERPGAAKEPVQGVARNKANSQPIEDDNIPF